MFCVAPKVNLGAADRQKYKDSMQMSGSPVTENLRAGMIWHGESV